MNLREALAAMMLIRHKLAVVDCLLERLDDLLPGDTDEAGTPLLADNAIPAEVPVEVIEQYSEQLAKQREALLVELEELQNTETRNAKRKKA
jgi:hypothetical protein